MNNPKITICITTYNRDETLKQRSLPSAIRQTFKDFEILIIDDCSLDNTEKVSKQFQNIFPEISIRYHKHSKNQGLAAARNTGALLAQGEYIVFLDDDDYLADSALEIGIKILDMHEDKQVVIGERLVIYPVSKERNFEKRQPPLQITPRTLYVTLDDGFIIRKKVFENIKYDEDLLTNEDADFGIQYMRLYGHQSIFLSNNVFLIKYAHEIGSPTSWNSPSERTFAGMEKYLEKNLPAYYENGDKNEIEYILRYMGRLYCQGGRMKQGIPYLWKACKTKPMLKNISLLLFARGGSRIFNWYYRKYETRRRTSKL